MMKGVILATLVVIHCAGPSMGAEQPQWGQWQSRNMVSGETNLPERFDPNTGENIKWSVPLGTQTNSSPVIAGGRVLIGTNNGRPRDPRHAGDRGILLCLDEEDGHLHWQLTVPKLQEHRLSDWPNTGICSPATVEDERVYLVNNRGEVMCLDLLGQHNGNDGPFRDEGRHMTPPPASPLPVTMTDADILWIFDIRKELGVHQHDAAHCSVLVDGPLLYVSTSNGVSDNHRSIVARDAPSLIVLEKQTGRLVARDNEHMAPGTIHCTWSSPALGTINNRNLVFFGGGDAVCYAFAIPPVEPAGKTRILKHVWRFDCDPGAPKEDVIRFQDNRRVGPSTITGMPVVVDNRVYITAGGDFWHGKPRCWLKCIDARGRGDITKNAERWSYPLERHCMSTPSVTEDLIFIGDCGRILHCIDTKTGKAHWTHRTRGEIWASTLVADGKVHVGSRGGDFLVLAATREKKVLSQVNLEPVHSTPTAANGALYVATMERLYAISKANQ